MKGDQGLVAQRKGRSPKEPAMKKKTAPAERTPSEREGMIFDGAKRFWIGWFVRKYARNRAGDEDGQRRVALIG